MAEKHRELATNRLLDIIRRGGTASHELTPEGADQRPQKDRVEPQHPEVEISGAAAPSPPEKSAKAPEPESAPMKRAGKLREKSTPRPKAVPARGRKIPPKKQPETEEPLTDMFMPVTKRVARRLKSALSDVRFPAAKPAVRKEKPAKKAVKRTAKAAALKVRVKGKRVFALDIGNAAVKMIEVVKNGGESRVVSVGISKIPRGLREGQAGLNVLLAKTVRELMPTDRMKNAALHVLLPDRYTQVRRLEVPEVTPKERLNAIKFQINKELPFPVEFCDISYSGFDPKIKGRQEIEVMAIDRRELDRRIDILDEIALVPNHITSTPVTMRFLIDGYKGIETDKGAVVIVDIGAAKTTINIMEKGKLILCRTVATGSDDFTEVLYGLTLEANGQELTLDSAEEYKIGNGLPVEGAPETMRIAILMRPVAERISAEISRSIDFYSRQKDANALQKLILIGGGALMKRLPEFLSEHLGIIVEVGDPLARIELDSALSDEDRKILEQQGPAFLPVLSIALDDGRTQNVLPPELKSAEKLKSVKRLVPAAALSLIFVMISMYGMALSERNGAESEYESLKKQLTGLVKHRTDYLLAKAQVDNLQNQLIQRGEDFSTIAEKAPEIPKYLQLLSNLVPSYIYLDQLRTRYIIDPNTGDESSESEVKNVSEAEVPENFKPTYDRVLADLLGKREEEQVEMKKRPIYGKVLEIEGKVYLQGTLTEVRLTNFIYDLETSGWFRDVAIDSYEHLESGRIGFKIICGL